MAALPPSPDAIGMKKARNMLAAGKARAIVWRLMNHETLHELPGAAYSSAEDALRDPRLPDFPGYIPQAYAVVKSSRIQWIQGQGRAGNAYRAKVPCYDWIEIKQGAA